MYSVMIVDDEPTIREGLRTLVDWASFGFSVTDTAVSGSDALSKCERNLPDVMIVDIRMPRMSGLELIERIRARDRRVRFLILSGYADFDYARKAIQYNTDGYLLKPVDEDELTDYLKKLKDVLDRERAVGSGADDRRLPEQWAQAILLEESRDKQMELACLATRSGIPWPAGEAVLIRPMSADPLPPVHFSKLSECLTRLVKEGKRGIAVALNPQILLVVKGADDDLGRELLLRAVEPVFRREGLMFVAVSGGKVGGYAELPDAWSRMTGWMETHRFFLDGGRIFTESALRARMEELKRLPEAAEADGDGGDEDLAGRLYLAADVGHGPLVRETARIAGAAMIRSGLGEEGVKAGFVRLLSAVFHKFLRQDAALKDEIEALSARLLDIHREVSYAACLERVCALLDELSARSAFVSGNEKRIRRMVDFIHRHYAENLKLETLARLFNYNSAYLGKLFKQTTGEYFNTYLDRVRIEQAKRLLKQGEKVYAVAEKVGYANVDYFYGKFRRYVGMSPTDYRKSVGNGGESRVTEA